MNIQEAKDEIKRALRVYTARDQDGNYRIPTEKQRPILLIGPPGIGKTAIMKQIAEEADTGLVSYTMTHHTRQSAIGLPMVRQRTFGDVTMSVTEYTMSEIIASMYIYMEETGHREGILFLDEINCVSETLTPVMLQLLQNKTFGSHQLPEGWIIVAAGNPPEYNRSVRELDMVTLDRVKNMEIEADLGIWQRYAAEHHVHPAVRAYLSLYPDHFYQICRSVRGQSFVTARGWEDLSTILTAYEEYGEEITDSLFLQYLQHDEISHSFLLFYRTFRDACEEMARAGSSYTSLLTLVEKRSGHLTPVQTLAFTAMLSHRLQAEAEERSNALDHGRSVCRILQQAVTGDDPGAFFAGKRNALKIRREHGLVTTQQEFEEESVLRECESLLSECRPAELKQLPEAESSRRAQADNEALNRISADIEDTYRALELLNAGTSDLVYFTTDLTHDRFLCQILTERPSAAYARWSGISAVIL